jgi:hypothetical protein
LRAGIIEFAGLADHDRTGADDQDTFYVCAFWHGGSTVVIPAEAGIQ